MVQVTSLVTEMPMQLREVLKMNHLMKYSEPKGERDENITGPKAVLCHTWGNHNLYL